MYACVDVRHVGQSFVAMIGRKTGYVTLSPLMDRHLAVQSSLARGDT